MNVNTFDIQYRKYERRRKYVREREREKESERLYGVRFMTEISHIYL